MIHLGCSGWFYGHWVRRFYPEELKEREWLEYYAKYFNTVEVNSTYYHMPNKKMLISWLERTPKNFIFTLKANRRITHIKKLHNVKQDVKLFYKLSDILKDKLGCILFQLPPSIKKNLDKLESFLKILDKKYKNVIEFRHESWFSEDTYELLRKYKTAFCIISSPEFKTESIKTANFSYFRWHGTSNWYGDNYSNAALKEYAKKIKALKCNVYGYFNNDSNAYAVKNCLTLKKLLKIK